MKSDPKKSLRVGKFIATVYEVYFPGDHGLYGTDADHLPVIPGNNVVSEVGSAEVCQEQDPASGNLDMGHASIGE